MLLPMIAIIAVVSFGVLAIVFSVSEERLKKELAKRDELQKRRLYEITILKAIQDRIGYSLDSQQVVQTIISSLKNLFPYSTASSLLVKDHRLIFTTNIDERISSKFIDQVKKSMIASLATLTTQQLPQQIEENRLGLPVDESNEEMIRSFFHIPLVVNGEVVGLINVASTKPGLYKDADMTILYQITNQASTALSKLQQVIHSEEGKLLALIGSLSDGIFMLDKDSKLTLINQTAKKLLNIETNTPAIFDVLSPLSKVSDFGAKLQSAMRENKTIIEDELQVNQSIVRIVITPVLQTTEEQPNAQPYALSSTRYAVIGASVTLHDITLEKSLNRLKEDFTSAIVHELRSPLTAIKAGSALMIEEKDKLDIVQQDKMLEIINKQSQRMLTDINSLLDAAKLESGHFTIYPKPSNVRDALEESVTLFAPELKQKTISISIDTEQNLPMGNFDPIRIEQVINNLISNSIKFTPVGGSILIKARKNHNEYLPKTTTNPGIIVSISDNGVGIPKDKQGKLFSKFAQIENIGYVHGAEGTGLGLYIAKGIVEAHGGNIFLQSIPQHGTVVSFTLPLAQVEIKPVEEKPLVPKPQLQQMAN
jgi:signal transduction histidine kinase